ncbi:MAG TPA: gliding motility-associated ABC transporter substrate-binding protein GldG [Bacteroidales bacterium]|nr:gliding motility-associated ABC transporter substrate-binding protein GldG [Bacteroidales bacterium]
MAKNKQNNLMRNSLIQLGLGLLIIILANIIGSYWFTRFDLTSEKRYSLSPVTKNLLKEIDDIVYFQVYLDGEFPAGFKRLRNATKEMLDEFRAYNKNIQYEFVNPSASDNEQERNDTYQLLVEKGLQPTDLKVNTKEGLEQQIIFPGAIVTYKSNELPVELLNSQIGVDPEDVLNNSVQALEFRLASAIRELTVIMKPSVAFVRGHGELDNREIYDIGQALSKQYSVSVVSIGGQLNSLTKRDSVSSDKTRIINKFDAIIIAKPDSAFSEKDKFIIDQFIMRGGKVLWLIDPVFASMDSLQRATETLGIGLDLNLEDMLFRYGVRLNANLIMDLNALSIPLRTGQVGNQPQIDFFPWYYFPVITLSENHPIVRNLNAIKTEFISSIDTIKVAGVKKTILLRSSPYSRTVNAPALITLAILEQEPDERAYTGPQQPVAVLLEGELRSIFENRIPPEISTSRDIGFIPKSEPTKMIVVADGDIIRNQLHFSQGYPLPLGYDQYTRQSFGNKDFILNALDYLIDESGLISIRSREVKLRQLDMPRVTKNKIFWQAFNVILPVIFVIIFGIIRFYLRKRKYTGI